MVFRKVLNVKKSFYLVFIVLAIIISFWVWTLSSIKILPISLGGSTSANSFMQKFTSVIDGDYSYNSTGSQNAITGVHDDVYAAGVISKQAEEYYYGNSWDNTNYKPEDLFKKEYIDEKWNNKNEFSGVEFGIDGIAIIYNLPKISNSELKNNELFFSKEILKKIYSGEITSWNEISKNILSNTKIITYTRESGSGTRTSFSKYISNNDDFDYKTSLVVNSNGTMLQNVRATPGSIGFISYSFVKQIYSNDSIFIAGLESKEDPKTYYRFGYAKDKDSSSAYKLINNKWDVQKISNEDLIKNNDYDLKRPFNLLFKNSNIKKIEKLLKGFSDYNGKDKEKQKQIKDVYDDEGLIYKLEEITFSQNSK